MHRPDHAGRTARQAAFLTAMAALPLLVAPLGAETTLDHPVSDYARITLVQPPGSTMVPGAFGEMRLSTEDDGGRWLSVHGQFAANLVTGFDTSSPVESWQGAVFGSAALILQGRQLSQREQTLQRGTPLFGTRLVAVLDACQPGGQPIGLLLVTPTNVADPLADPVLGSLLGAVTLHLGPEVAPCPPELLAGIALRLGTVPRDRGTATDAGAEGGDAGYQRIEAHGLSLAFPLDMQGGWNDHAARLTLTGGPHGLEITIEGQHAFSRRNRTHEGVLDLGAEGIFDIYTEHQTGLPSQTGPQDRYTTFLVGQTRVTWQQGGTERNGHPVVQFSHMQADLPDLGTLAALHAGLIALLRPAGV